MTHYFLALRFDKKATEKIKYVNDVLKESISGISYKVWVNDADYHLTLHFFGALDQIDVVIDMMKQMDLPSVTLTFSKVNGFGRQDGYRVVFLEPHITKRLRVLYESIQEKLALRGFQTTNRPFYPHITLAKKCQTLWNKENRLAQINTILMEKYLPFDTQPVILVLYKIEPDKLPKYSVVFERKSP
ncbi:2'-5' RNA ligase [Halolactibacillus halophilus]|uniref:RNA 2',3'-cyclic phosphodiesterase n=1 Tax=Halolactibacillus halophilus TaxID=306540 RepID=A0A1I5Q3D8_9BACI|nr:RNA 2',3'-cyclic phosphodiesterase [Halolactibacillus halophilus]GEM02834.1 RNA 2',3'-cyclic phosphodiesterase [Halolactibacillus halophilus]SFP40874.1 2'-5' RNA ligase [Halolactibacillus halophilus]